MTYIWFWVHWLAERTPKTLIYKFTKVGRLTGRDTKEVAKILLRLPFPTGNWVLRKIQSTTPQRTHTYIWLWVHSLEEHGQKSCKYIFTKSGRLTGRDPSEGVKIILYLHFLTWRQVLRKNQPGLSNRKKLRGSLIFDSGCIGWQSTPQNLFNINLPIVQEPATEVFTPFFTKGLTT